MRILPIVAVALLCGCSTAGTDLKYAMSKDGAPVPTPTIVKVSEPVRNGDMSAVERWTRDQRQCEVGDREEQRRCIMPYPGN